MKTVAATGLLFFLICHDCAFAAASGDHHARDWSARAYNRRSLAQASNDEASTTADEPPNQCKVVTGNTTNSCFRTCMTCQASRSGPNHRPCTCCKAGFKQSRIAARCWQCEIGAFALAGDNKCTRCPTGYSTVSTASSVCDACAPGYEWARNATGGDSCQACAPGYVRRTRAAITSRPQCTICPVGRTTLRANRVSCGACLPGYAGAACYICPKGSYSGGGAATKELNCARCSNGTTTLQAGSTSVTQCVAGPPGPAPPPSPLSPSPEISPTPESPAPMPVSPSPESSPSPTPQSPAPQSPTPQPPTPQPPTPEPPTPEPQPSTPTPPTPTPSPPPPVESPSPPNTTRAAAHIIIEIEGNIDCETSEVKYEVARRVYHSLLDRDPTLQLSDVEYQEVVCSYDPVADVTTFVENQYHTSSWSDVTENLMAILNDESFMDYVENWLEDNYPESRVLKKTAYPGEYVPSPPPVVYTSGVAHANFTVDRADCSAMEQVAQQFALLVKEQLPNNNITADLAECVHDAASNSTKFIVNVHSSNSTAAVGADELYEKLSAQIFYFALAARVTNNVNQSYQFNSGMTVARGEYVSTPVAPPPPPKYTSGAAHTNFTVTNINCSQKAEIAEQVALTIKDQLSTSNITAVVVECVEDADMNEASFIVNVYNVDSTAADAEDELYGKMDPSAFLPALSGRIQANVGAAHAVSTSLTVARGEYVAAPVSPPTPPTPPTVNYTGTAHVQVFADAVGCSAENFAALQPLVMAEVAKIMNTSVITTVAMDCGQSADVNYFYFNVYSVTSASSDQDATDQLVAVLQSTSFQNALKPVVEAAFAGSTFYSASGFPGEYKSPDK